MSDEVRPEDVEAYVPEWKGLAPAARHEAELRPEQIEAYVPESRGYSGRLSLQEADLRPADLLAFVPEARSFGKKAPSAPAEPELKPEDVEAHLGWAPPLVDNEQSRRHNGETDGLMEHLRFLKLVGGDTSIDQPWEVDTSCFARFCDAYVVLATFSWLLVKVPVLYLPLAVAFAPLLLIVRLHAALLQTPTTRLERGRSFRLLVALEVLAGLPFLLLTLLSLALDSVAYYAFFLPFCLLTGGLGRYLQGVEVLGPYQGGPALLCNLPDLAALAVGQVLRQGCGRFLTQVVTMVLVNPVLKYFVNTNPFVYRLEERFVNQMSASWRDMPMGQIVDKSVSVMCDAKHSDGIRERLHEIRFAPHCPHPPQGRRWALGVQATGMTALLMHTTHKAITNGGPECLVVSSSCLMPAFRMVLWYNNPFHIFTGYVEAQITTGMPSQLDKFRGGEHPMWLVTSHSPLLARRASYMGVGCIDRHFERWLPRFTYELRRLIRGKDEADGLRDQAARKEVRRPVSMKRVPASSYLS